MAVEVEVDAARMDRTRQAVGLDVQLVLARRDRDANVGEGAAPPECLAVPCLAGVKPAKAADGIAPGWYSRAGDPEFGAGGAGNGPRRASARCRPTSPAAAQRRW